MEAEQPKAFKAVYDVPLVGMSKRAQNLLIDRTFTIILN